MISKENAKETEVENLKEEFERLKEHTDAIFQTATGFQQVYERHESLTKRKEMFERNRERIKEEMNVLKGTNRCCGDVRSYSLGRTYRGAPKHVQQLRCALEHH